MGADTAPGAQRGSGGSGADASKARSTQWLGEPGSTVAGKAPGAPDTPLPALAPARAWSGPAPSPSASPCAVSAARPEGAVYEATYVAPAATSTGVGSGWVCQPAAVSAVNAAVASRLPCASHRRPTCGPAFPGVFQKRSAVTRPATSARQRTPSSAGAPASSAPPTTVSGHSVQAWGTNRRSP